MLKIYHTPGTRGWRAMWACEELGTPYEVIPVDFSPEYRHGKEYRQINPLGKVPTMTDGELLMFESCAMVQYIIDKYGNGELQPAPGTEAHAIYLQWCWYSESTFARPLGEVVNHRRSFPDDPIERVLDEMKGRGTFAAQAVSDALAGKTYLLGDEFSAADINMGWTLRTYRRLVGEDMPGELNRYWATLAARPAFVATEAADAAST
ncbi:MAG: glutathione S-transferase family protein [Pseudomonadota bacterium]